MSHKGLSPRSPLDLSPLSHTMPLLFNLEDSRKNLLITYMCHNKTKSLWEADCQCYTVDGTKHICDVTLKLCYKQSYEFVMLLVAVNCSHGQHFVQKSTNYYVPSQVKYAALNKLMNNVNLGTFFCVVLCILIFSNLKCVVRYYNIQIITNHAAW